MSKRTLPQRVHTGAFDAHLVRETAPATRLHFMFLEWEEEELDKLAENEFRAKYQVEYEKACAQAEDGWYPYHAVGVIDDQQKQMYQSHEIDSILKTRWSELRNKVRAQYIETMFPEVNKALERRAMLEPIYDTEWGFRVKSRGEQLIANALRFYTITNQNTGERKRVTLLYEPLFRIPDESRVIIPDFAIPEYSLIIEYAGLEERNYKIGLFMKMEAIRKIGFPIVIMRPEDLDDVGCSLSQKLKFYFDFEISKSEPF